ncbi:hypothetical protein ASD01_08295 [Ensifer sp. Root423]|nr:hypothetical protein ASD01_08295 [Ensifer sp. Root423]
MGVVFALYFGNVRYADRILVAEHIANKNADFVDIESHRYPYAAAAFADNAVQLHGSNCSSLVIEVSAMRASTSASHAWGSISLSLALMISVAMKAARSAPRSEPVKSYAFLPRAKPRNARSAVLLLRHIRPSPTKDVKPSQRFSL